jgi:hypothetical protein
MLMLFACFLNHLQSERHTCTRRRDVGGGKNLDCITLTIHSFLGYVSDRQSTESMFLYGSLVLLHAPTRWPGVVAAACVTASDVKDKLN